MRLKDGFATGAMIGALMAVPATFLIAATTFTRTHSPDFDKPETYYEVDAPSESFLTPFAQRHKQLTLLYFARQIEKNPRDKYAYLRLGNAKNAFGNCKGAIEEYDKALALDPLFVSALMMRGCANANHGNFRGSLADLRLAENLEPNRYEVHANLGTVLETIGRIDEAHQQYSKAILLHPSGSDYVSLANRAWLNLRRNKIVEARADADRVVNVAPDKVISHYTRGAILEAQNNKLEALKAFNRAISVSNFSARIPMIFYRRGLIKDALGDYDSAVLDFDEAIKYSPNNSELYCSRGIANLSRKAYDLARKDFDRAISLKPTSSYFYLCRASASAQLKQFDAAISDFSKSLALRKTTTALLFRANVYCKNKNYQQALNDCNAAVERDPNDARAYNERAATLTLLGRNAEALADASIAIKLDPEVSRYHWMRGGVNCQLFKHSDACRDYTKALSLEKRKTQRSQLLFVRSKQKRLLGDPTFVFDLASAFIHDPHETVQTKFEQ